MADAADAEVARHAEPDASDLVLTDDGEPERRVISEPGVYADLPSADYHADPCPQPSASSTVLKTLMAKSPRHAALEHPRLEPHAPEAKRKDFDVGSAAHAMLLGQPDPIRVIEADGYQTKAAKAERDAAYAAGQIPALKPQYERVCAMVDAARAQLAVHQDAYDAFDLSRGDAELTLIWQDDGVWCRARLDYLRSDRPLIYDYKTTAASAHPGAWGQRTLWQSGCDLQAGFYRRAVKAVYGTTPEIRFVVQETAPPYALSVVALDAHAQEMADQRADRALHWWRQCLRADRWPAYPARTAYVEAPVRQEYQAEDEKARAEDAGDFQQFIDWQAPLEAAE